MCLNEIYNKVCTWHLLSAQVGNTSPRSGGRSVGIVRSRTQTMKFFFFFFIGKLLSDNFPIQNGLKQGVPLLLLLFNFALQYAIRKVQETRWK
jgi:hypothetical protein